jgi:hypothetical protein
MTALAAVIPAANDGASGGDSDSLPTPKCNFAGLVMGQMGLCRNPGENKGPYQQKRYLRK